MKIEATKEDIRLLLELTALDGDPEGIAPSAHARARAAAESRLPDELLARYRCLTAMGRYPVMVGVEREACAGCHVRLSTMLASLVKRSIGIYLCPGCRRLLYAPELLSEPKAEGSVDSQGRARRSSRQTSALES
jgi:predicted  nucleic acid-binding Zn-ribbon protein